MAVEKQPVVLINAFEVPAEADEQFIKGWERLRDVLQSQDGYISTTLHRSVRPDADFRFVNIALWRSPEAFRAATSQPAFRQAPTPYPFHASLYEVVREEDPRGEAAGAAVLINLFEVPPGADDEFIRGWESARDYLRQQDGYISARLHRSLAPDADFRFVNVALWASPRAFRAAVESPGFRALDGTPYPNHPALYEVVRQ